MLLHRFWYAAFFPRLKAARFCSIVFLGTASLMLSVMSFSLMGKALIALRQPRKTVFSVRAFPACFAISSAFIFAMFGVQVSSFWVMSSMVRYFAVFSVTSFAVSVGGCIMRLFRRIMPSFFRNSM